MIGCTFASARSRFPLMSNWTSAECRSREIWVDGESSGLRTLITFGSRDTIWTTPAIALWNAGSEARTSALWTSTLSVAGVRKPAPARMCSATAASPDAASPSAISWAPTQPPSRTATTVNASQPNVARFQWRALQPPARAARLRLLCWAILRPKVVRERTCA